ncbi:membrane-bound lytic murein transglycosylase MltF [Zophobihabitans entericus]|uniref:Membrane-bound lytic murein transglycosylase F n=1 Tax=Zophobihabitans entericus TaxID=1635327 RepID=A0A6G9IF37_9GAMM|nr:membrane-bound lytic murein transglycosylase MltF [Zophobihabitans entericus]QIQ22210.1 membrane-bound lytic murein transglycosylase MltF [Zophobihabitans entericus]
MIKKVIYWGIGAVTMIFIIMLMTFYNSSKRPQEPDITRKEQGRPTNLLQHIQTRQELRVGMLRTLTPFYINYRSPNKMSGFDHALLTLFANSLNVKLKVTLADTMPELLEKMENGELDIIAEEVQGYSEYSDKFLASQPYHSISQQVVYRKGSTKPYSFEELTNGTLAVSEKSLQNVILDDLKNDYPDLTWDCSPTLNQEELLKLVFDQEIDYTIADSYTVLLMQRIYPALTVAFTAVQEQPLHWYFLQNNDKSLLEQANRFIHSSRESGTIKRLELRYFGYMNSFDYVDTRTFIRAIQHTLPDYQPLFEKYAQENNLDWRLLAAMAYQESHWNPKAISSTGVRGMMMLTQSTAQSLNVTNRLDAEQSIRGGTQYLRQLINRLPKSIPEDERVWFALAAYNMGYAHLLDARRLATRLGKNPDSWIDVKQMLPLLTEEEYYTTLKYGAARGYQAVHFVNSIRQYNVSLSGYLMEKEYRQKEIETKIEIANQLSTNNDS